MNATQRTVPVLRAGKVERMTASAHLRLRLMFRALEAGLELEPGTVYWAAMAPLKQMERDGVRREVARLMAMPPPERSSELLMLKAEGNIP